MQRSNFRGWVQTLLHLGYYFISGLLAYYVFTLVNADTWTWAIPLLLLTLFAHGTIGPFMGLIAVHELQHRTVFKTRWLNRFFEKLYAFLSWSDYIWYQKSHTIHHKVTCHAEHDGEVVLPVKYSLKHWKVWLGFLAWNPEATWVRLKTVWQHANGEISGSWYRYVLPEQEKNLRRKHRNWARLLLAGHGTLALAFILSGHWFLVVLFTFGTFYCSWLGFLCGIAQHYGLNSDVPDFRMNSRTFTCSRLVGFFYWNMQYHLEHHMFPAVPFYNLPSLREALAFDLPPAPHGLWATWKEMQAIKANIKQNPDYRFVPDIPSNNNIEPTRV